MPARTNRSPESRSRLSKERVLTAAIELADRGGIESLTMRKLAEALGVEAMSLYYYVKNKNDILDGIVDMVVSQIEIPRSDQNWKAAIRSSSISAHQVLSRHPWACSLMLSRESPSRLRYTEGLLAALRRGGFSAMMTHHAYHALDSHITGFTLWRVSFRFDVKDIKELATNFLERIPVDEYPYSVEHVHQHLDVSGKQDKSEFEFGLDLILDGLERLMVEEKPK